MSGAGRSIVAARAALIVLGALTAVAFACWRADRARTWERPDWDPSGFERLDAGAGGVDRKGSGGSGRAKGLAFADADLPIWVVPVNPACASCVAVLAEAYGERARRGAPVRLVALVVDAPRRPDRAALARLRADAVHWDRRQVWRRRWGHRVYGEALAFTPGGRYVRTIPAGTPLDEVLPAADLGVPPDDL